MKNFAFILFFYLLVLPMSVMSKTVQEGSPYISKAFDITGDAALEIKTAGASIQIEAWDNDQVLVEVFVKRNGKLMDPTDPEIAEKLEAFEFEVVQEGQKINVIMQSKSKVTWNMGRNQLNFAFEIHAPERTSADLRSAGGSIAISGLDGRHNLVSSGGTIRLMDCAGDFQAKSSGGSFSVESFVGNMDISSSGGSVKVFDLVGGLKVNSSGGSLTVEDISGSMVANTSGGSIRANLLSLEGEVSLKTSGGGITATLPKNEGLDLDLRGTSSKMRLENFQGEISSNTIKGKMNGGGVPVYMASSGGSVKIDFK
ncbi:hypothetical protein A33Q_3560 [Indibacter alkaliphilus LW1]|uniref:DUF4097 domain-containing protein n=1 Tax=Indibacter alkaliphilus (strain CCUG 57479 / KCTC 22604 / LW1) TaxID=1189612 RepID=S2D3Z4_INDAL|nr:DUF4097 family beta strand repeat-containing protein [Indibacter alkaliphilus]EOZ93614.1 hypothetical protein A33Q_3560 [Indibacter alkaliphilus LW1]